MTSIPWRPYSATFCVIEIDDGIAFEARSVKTAEIRKEAGCGGVRVELRATLDGAQLSLQIDIGFGDVVTPAPETVTYPVLLDDLPAPTLRAYPSTRSSPRNFRRCAHSAGQTAA